MKISVLLLVLLLPQIFTAQMVVTPIADVPVYRENLSEIHNPWTGGINAAELSVFDADYDGEADDLFIFDKAGDRVLIFTGEMDGNERIYSFRPEMARNFPNLRSWALMRDFDCDGNDDIFTYGVGSFAVYRNTGNSQDGIAFEFHTEAVLSDYVFQNNQYETNIYVSSQDIPAIFDFEGDGDLDILTFSVNGTMVELHINYSVETNGICGLDTFLLKNRCYGRFVEGSENNGIIQDPEVVSSTCTFNVVNPKSNKAGGNQKGARHIGSTILAFDANQDVVPEIILGDVTYTNLTYLENNDRPDPQVDSVGFITADFPANLGGEAVDIDNFPAGFYEDVSGDGIRDLIVGVNSSSSSANKESVWYYKNNGEDNLPDFELIQHNFLQDQTIDYGEGSAPAFFDYNADGLMDMVIGSRGVYLGLGNYKPALSLYLNTGTLSSPEFTIADEDWLSVSTLELGQYPNPTFGDIDGDGDIDLLLGSANGEVFLFANSAGAGNTANLTLQGNIMADGETLDAGQNSAPQLFDLNQDGKLDLIVGERNGNLNYFENIGSATNYSFSLITDTLGGLTSIEPNYFIGNSSPDFYRFDGETYLALGGESGKIHLYTGIDNNLSGNFELISLSAFNIDAGKISSPKILDINNDNIPDVFCGGIGGGISLFLGDYLVGLNEANGKNALIKIYPNPAQNSFRVAFPDSETGTFNYTLYSISGKSVLKGATSDNTIDISGIARGMFILEVNRSGLIYRTKVLKN